MNLLQARPRGFGRIDMGVYAEVIGGEIATSERIAAA